MQAQKKHLIAVVILLLAAIGCYFGVRQYNLDSAEKTEDKSYEAFSIEKDNVRELAVTTSEGSYVLEYEPDTYAAYQKALTAPDDASDPSDSESDGSASKADGMPTGWSFVDDSGDKVNASLAAELLDEIDLIVSEDEITDAKDASEFGFDSPTATIVVKMADGTTHELLVGAYNKTIDKYYFRADDAKSIYTVNKEFYTNTAHSYDEMKDAGDGTADASA